MQAAANQSPGGSDLYVFATIGLVSAVGAIMRAGARRAASRFAQCVTGRAIVPALLPCSKSTRTVEDTLDSISKAWGIISCGEECPGPAAVDDAARSSRAVRVTRSIEAKGLSAWISPGSTQIDLVLKMESEQSTGSFKARGAIVAVGAMAEAAKATGKDSVQPVTASTGNHGKATSRAVSLWRSGALGSPGQSGTVETQLLPARVHVPSNVAPHKLAALQKAGAEVVVASRPDCAVAEAEARQEAEAADGAGSVRWQYVSPYNDSAVVAGQATLAVEWAAQQAARLGINVHEEQWWRGSAAPFDSVFVPVGGGGLVAGVGAYLKAVWGPAVEVVGCQPAANAAMLRCLQAGRALDDGYCGDAEADSEAGGDGPQLLQDLPPVEEWVELPPPAGGAGIRCPTQLQHPAGRSDGRSAPRSSWPYRTWLNLDTLSDGTAGGVEGASVTLQLCAEVVDAWECVPEASIGEAQAQALAREGLVVEGAAAVALAALRQRVAREPGYATVGEGKARRPRRVGVVVCGGNMSGEGLLLAAQRAAASGGGSGH